jgi:two-component system phosphate regulon response regulator PhoB
MILVVDDEEGVAGAIKGVLEHGGFSVAVASSCEQALAIVDEHRPELIFSDVNMPGHSGLELLRFLKASTTTSDIPLVLVSARAREQDVQNGLLAGAAAYITKPIEPGDLIGAIKALLPNAPAAT